MDPNIHFALRAANTARQAEWDADAVIDAAYRGNELAGEVGEACNVIKKLERERRGIPGSRDTVEHLADELADVIICTDLIAMGYGIDLDTAVARKFNATSEKVGLTTRMAGAPVLIGMDFSSTPDVCAMRCACGQVHTFGSSDTAVARRFRHAADILEGMTDGIDGDRLGALVRWALNGKASADEEDALVRAFEAPWIGAADEAGFEADTQQEARNDIERVSREAVS